MPGLELNWPCVILVSVSSRPPWCGVRALWVGGCTRTRGSPPCSSRCCRASRCPGTGPRCRTSRASRWSGPRSRRWRSPCTCLGLRTRSRFRSRTRGSFCGWTWPPGRRGSPWRCLLWGASWRRRPRSGAAAPGPLAAPRCSKTRVWTPGSSRWRVHRPYTAAATPPWQITVLLVQRLLTLPERTGRSRGRGHCLNKAPALTASCHTPFRIKLSLLSITQLLIRAQAVNACFYIWILLTICLFILKIFQLLWIQSIKCLT